MDVEIIVKILFAHFAADYLFQTRAGAINKSVKGMGGLISCLLHCAIYVASFCLFFQRANALFVLVIFCSHFFIDRYSLAYHWLRLTRGRDILNPSDNRDLAFGCIVYVVTDNLMHLMMIYYAFKWGVV